MRKESLMHKNEWLELVEQAELASHAVSRGGIDGIIEEVLELVNLIHYKAGDAAEQGGWFTELKNYIDTMTFAD